MFENLQLESLALVCAGEILEIWSCFYVQHRYIIIYIYLDLRTLKNYCLFRLFPTFVCDRPKKVGCDLVFVQTAALAFFIGKRG